MPRQRTVWFHAGTGYWCSKISGKRVYLDKDKSKAEKQLARLLAGEVSTRREWDSRPFDELADEFLADCEARLKPLGFSDYRDSIERARPYIDGGLTVGDFRKIHLRKLEQGLVRAGMGPTTVNKTIHAVQRVFNWAVELELLAASPLTGYKRPAARQRTRVISPEEFRALLRVAVPNFRRLLIALRWTGCRPGELRNLLWGHVDLDSGLWILPEHKTIGRQRQPCPRTIPLASPVLKLCRWLAARRRPGEEHVFLNRSRKPWKMHSISLRVRVLRRRAGLPAVGGEEIVPYSARHTFATEAVGKVADKELAELLGHTTPQTLNRYVHINRERLRDIARRAAGGA